jgi:hypothetical protein
MKALSNPKHFQNQSALTLGFSSDFWSTSSKAQPQMKHASLFKSFVSHGIFHGKISYSLAAAMFGEKIMFLQTL